MEFENYINDIVKALKMYQPLKPLKKIEVSNDSQLSPSSS